MIFMPIFIPQSIYPLDGLSIPIRFNVIWYWHSGQYIYYLHMISGISELRCMHCFAYTSDTFGDNDKSLVSVYNINTLWRHNAICHHGAGLAFSHVKTWRRTGGMSKIETWWDHLDINNNMITVIQKWAHKTVFEIGPWHIFMTKQTVTWVIQ